MILLVLQNSWIEFMGSWRFELVQSNKVFIENTLLIDYLFINLKMQSCCLHLYFTFAYWITDCLSGKDQATQVGIGHFSLGVGVVCSYDFRISILRNFQPSWAPILVRAICHGTLPLIILGVLKLAFLDSTVHMWLHSVLFHLKSRTQVEHGPCPPEFPLLPLLPSIN